MNTVINTGMMTDVDNNASRHFLLLVDNWD